MSNLLEIFYVTTSGGESGDMTDLASMLACRLEPERTCERKMVRFFSQNFSKKLIEKYKKKKLYTTWECSINL